MKEISITIKALSFGTEAEMCNKSKYQEITMTHQSGSKVYLTTKGHFDTNGGCIVLDKDQLKEALVFMSNLTIKND